MHNIIMHINATTQTQRNVQVPTVACHHVVAWSSVLYRYVTVRSDVN